MGQPSWCYEGNGYVTQWDPATKGIRILWGDLLDIPCCAPVATVSPSSDILSDPLQSLPKDVVDSLRRWNRKGVLSGGSEGGDRRFRDDGLAAGLKENGEAAQGSPGT